ncbi:MAG: hypothetical protein JWP91_3597 [Fibrobacteres bacterium]|nr:hypothetical protein [Fibrobacterota bacterium]
MFKYSKRSASLLKMNRPLAGPSGPERVLVVLEKWSRSDLLSVLEALNGVPYGSVEVTIRASRVVRIQSNNAVSDRSARGPA